LRAVGVQGKGADARGGALASYILFEAPYTRALVELGVADTLRRRDDVLSFFGWIDARQNNAVTPIVEARRAAMR
jgi:NTE family protein